METISCAGPTGPAGSRIVARSRAKAEAGRRRAVGSSGCWTETQGGSSIPIWTGSARRWRGRGHRQSPDGLRASCSARAAAALIVAEAYFAALLLILVSRLCDGLDGAVARHTMRTDSGGYLDIVLDFGFLRAGAAGLRLGAAGGECACRGAAALRFLCQRRELPGLFGDGGKAPADHQCARLSSRSTSPPASPRPTETIVAFLRCSACFPTHFRSWRRSSPRSAFSRRRRASSSPCAFSPDACVTPWVDAWRHAVASGDVSEAARSLAAGHVERLRQVLAAGPPGPPGRPTGAAARRRCRARRVRRRSAADASWSPGG